MRSRAANPVALAVKFHGRSIGELAKLSIVELAAFLGRLKLDARETAIAKDLIPEIHGRLGFLERVGLEPPESIGPSWISSLPPSGSGYPPSGISSGGTTVSPSPGS